jgi:hypothetical protein
VIANFAANILEALTAPRRSARKILRAEVSLSDCVLMVILGVAVHGIVSSGLALIDPSLASMGGAGLGVRLAEIGVQIVMFFLLSGAAFTVGVRFGGKGSLPELRSVVAWHALATGFLAPLNVIGMSGVTPEGGNPGIGFLLVMVSVGVSVWVFASFIAEAHGFKNIGGVIGVTVMGFMLFGLVAMMLMGIVTGGGA